MNRNTTVAGLVSVVVASYNHARYLPRRMESLIGQTYPNIEILVIDDCSSDNSVEVLRAYTRLPRVRLIERETNGGWVTVSNQGIELARGEYVLFANCDDDCEPQMIERLVAALAPNPEAGLAFCRSAMVDEHGARIGDDFTVREPVFRARCADDCLLSRDEMRRFLMHSCVIPNLSAALIRRICFESVGTLSSEYRACSDWDFFFRIVDHFDIVYIATPLNHFRQHDRTIRNSTKGRITYDEFFRVLLGQIRHSSFSVAERSRFRLHTMYMWSIELLRPSTSGWRNFAHHTQLIAELDPLSLLYFLPAMMQRALTLPVKIVVWLMTRAARNILNADEWPLFVLHLRSSPWFALGYCADLFMLVCRRILQRLRMRVQRDAHRGLKQRPTWLPPAGATGTRITSLRLPLLELASTLPAVAMPVLCVGDPEAHFARHRWAKCMAALGDEMRAREAFAEVQAWLAQPPRRSHPAWESYSCCERVVNLAFLLAAHPELLRKTDEAQICSFFQESAAWIDSHLEYYGSVRTNNHFLNNGRALIVAGCVLRNDAWLMIGLNIVEHFAPKLFPIDGCLREGSSHYQLIVAGWLFDVLFFASLALPAARLARLEALACEVGRTCARFDTTLPRMDQHIGDISPDFPPQLTLARLRLLYGKRLAEVATGPALGEWLIAERGWSKVLARATRNWPHMFTTHAHADLGSFVWLYEGCAILADAGRQDYLPRPETQAQIGSAAHNTLQVNGVGPLAASVLRVGLWFPQPYANAQVEVDATAVGFVLRHNGFTRIPDVGCHHREVRLVESGLEVIDSIKGFGSVELSLNWHFAPGWLDEREDTLVSAVGRLRIDVDGARGARRVWSDYTHSRAYGEATSARSLMIAWRVELPYRIHTQMHFEPCVA